MITEIQQFLNRYCDAFNSLNGESIAKLYAIPSGIVFGKEYTHWPTFNHIAENMAALCKQYEEHGFCSASYELATFFRQGEHSVVADLSWTIKRTSGLEPWCFNTTYNLLHTSEGWRVLLCTAYEEKSLNALHRAQQGTSADR